MAFRVVHRFIDLSDNHEYEVGDNFPHDDRELEKARIKELSTKANKISTPLIEEYEIEESTEEVEAELVEEVEKEVKKSTRKSK